MIWVESMWVSTGTGASIGDAFSRSTDKGANFIARNLSNDPGRSYFPQVGVDASGTLYVFWLDDTAHDSSFAGRPMAEPAFRVRVTCKPRPDHSWAVSPTLP